MYQGGFGAFCLVLIVTGVFCQDVNLFDVFNDSMIMGRLSADCIQQYSDLYLTQDVPKRRYRYFHENNEFMNYRKPEDVEVQWRIVGGRKVDVSEAPYTVLYGNYCGGCLIAPDWVITAAHCRTTNDFIIAGATRASEGTHYHICAHFLHPGWENPEKPHFHDYDYQLLMLEKPVPVTMWSRPIAIGDISDVVPGAMVSITGWGHTAMKQRRMQDILHQVSVPIIPHEECQALPSKQYMTITPRMFCAGYYDGSKDACQGDSGGPAVVGDKLVGLVSFGVGCAEKEKPGVYSNVPLARPWIREVTRLPL